MDRLIGRHQKTPCRVPRVRGDGPPRSTSSTAEAPALEAHRAEFPIDIAETSFFLGRETPVPTVRPELSVWREKLYAFMGRNAVSASDYFQIPPKRVVELGTQVEL